MNLHFNLINKMYFLRVWSLICNKKKTIVLFERQCHVTKKSEEIACARRCRSSQLTRWWKNNQKKCRAKEEEERHRGSLTPKNGLLKK
jgi:hypothetical protein